jgi:hypothetical protein
MLTTKDFLAQYKNSSDEELFRMHSSLADYSEDAQEALKIVIEKRGGLEKLFEKHQHQLQIENEKERIRQETAKLYVNDANVDFLKNLITSDLISIQERQQIIEAKFSELRSEHEDKEIKPRTVFGSLIGGILGSLAGGVLWGLQMIQMHRIFFILIAALILISYGLIRLFTKQSKSNTMVLVATILSVVGALFIGQLIFTVFG